MRKISLVLIMASVCLCCLQGEGWFKSPAQATELVSVDSGGVLGNQTSVAPAISSDGRYVAFASEATNLVPGDTNGFADVFVRDRQTGETTRVSVSSTGVQGDGSSFTFCDISADGRYVVFGSEAANLVDGDTNGFVDIFVRDRQENTTTRVSVSSTGVQGNEDASSSDNPPWPRISSDGLYVAFFSDANNLVTGDTNGSSDVFLHNCQTGETTRVSVSSTGVQGNEESANPAISADGRYIAFDSLAGNLDPRGSTGCRQVYLHDRVTGQTTLVSVDSTGVICACSSFFPAISADGSYVAFWSRASNLVDGDTNGFADFFVRDRQTGETTRVSVSSTGVQGNEDASLAAISADGRYVAFSSEATNMVSGDTNGLYDVFVHDRQTGQTTRVSVASNGAQGNGHADCPAISADGRYIAFSSEATNLVSGDTNGFVDIFVQDTSALHDSDSDDSDSGCFISVLGLRLP